MGWDVRKGCRYYTRSRKYGGKVYRQYVGKGPEAERAAAEDERRRAEQHARRNAQRAEVARLEAADTPLQELQALTDLVFRAALTAQSYHEHRGEWRMRRHV